MSSPDDTTVLLRAAEILNAGEKVAMLIGAGTLGAAPLTPEQMETEITAINRLTDRPFGVDLLAALPESLITRPFAETGLGVRPADERADRTAAIWASVGPNRARKAATER